MSTYDHALAFTTSSNSDGYTLTGIKFDLTGWSALGYSLTVNTTVSGRPGEALGTLMAGSETGLFTHSGIDLAANTTYFVVFDSTSGSGRVRTTSRNTQTGMAGWSIADGNLYRSRSSTATSWTTWTNSFRMRIDGTAKEAADSTPSFGGSTISNQSYTQHREITELTLPAATGGNGTLTYALTGPNGAGLPAGLTFNSTTRKLTGTPTGSQAATTYTYKVTDSDPTNPDSVSLTFTIAVTTNAVPSFGASTIDDQSYTQGTQISTLTLPTATGGDGTLTYALVGTLPTGLSYNSTTRKLTGTPTATQAATTYTWQATDNNGDKAELTFTIAVTTPANRAPAFEAASYGFTLAENADGSTNAVTVGTVSASDADTGDTVSYSITGGDAGSVFAIGASTGAITYTGSGENHESFGTPASAFTLTVRASDGTASADVTVTVGVTDVDEAPGKPGAPTVSATAGSTTSLDVSWAAPANTGPAITGYDLRYRAGTSGGWTDGPQDETGTTAAIGSLTASTSYQVQVRATNAEGDGAWSDAGTGTTATQAQTQTLAGLTVGPAAGNATYLAVSWTAYPGAERYRLRWRAGSGPYNRWPQYVNRTHTTIAGLAAGTAYTVEVTAVSAANADLAQATAGGTTLAVMPGPVTVSAVAGSRRQLAVSWPAVTGNAGYRVQWKPAGDAFYSTTTNSATTAANATTYTIRRLTSGTVYDVKVTYLRPNGGSTVDGASATGRGTTNSTTTTPTSSTWTAKVERDEWNRRALIVSWQAYPDAARYRVQWKSGSESYSTSTRAAEVTGASNYTIHNLTVGTRYTVRVVALGTAGSVLATTPDMTRLRPDWLTDVYLDPVDGNSYALEVTWEPAAGAAGYVIEWKSSSETTYDKGTNDETPTVTLTGGDRRRHVLGFGDDDFADANTLYDVRVRYWTSEGRSNRPDGHVVSASRSTLPHLAQPTVATNGSTTLDVAWSAPTFVEPDVYRVTGYRVRWRTLTESTYPSANRAEVTGGATSYKMTGLTANTQYYVQVEPKLSYFGQTMYGSGARSRLTRTPTASPPGGGEPGGVGTAALTGLSVEPVAGDPTRLAVSWDAVEGAARYDVRWKTGSGDYGDSVQASTNGHTVTGLSAGTTYTVNVAALDADNTLLAEGEASGATAHRTAASQTESAPRLVVYHDPTDPAAVVRYEAGVQALGDAGVGHETRHASRAEVGALAGVAHSVMPRFFYGDPAASEWSPQPKVNNGGLRWLRAHLATLSGLSVADARVTEAQGATLAFAVTLASAATHAVTVDYATADGTATAGADYTATLGTLAFAAGETTKTISVPVLDDAHDEGEETLTLTLSNAAGAALADARATGTIANTDPLQAEWLARFGRTVAGQMVEALEGRFAMDPDTPSQMTIAGRRLDFAGAPLPEHHRWREEETRDMDLREVLHGSSFHFTTGEASGLGALTGWGKALTGSASSAPAGGLSLASETVTGVLGMDWERDALLLGVALSESVETGSVGLSSSGADYALEGSLSLVSPYARIRAGERLSLWTMMGSGEGALSLVHGDASQSADIAVRLVAAGGRAELLRPEGEGFSLALKTDAYLVRTESAGVSAPGVGNLAGARGDASRVRAVLEGSHAFSLSGGGSVEPSLTLGLRHDGGDGESGSGVELGAGLAWSDPSRGLTSDLRLYGLAAHEDAGYDEWGVSGSLRIAPALSGRGLSLSMTPSWGAEGESGRLWDTRPSALAGDGGEPPGARLDTELGYGLSLSGGLTGTPYVGLGLGEARDVRLGWRLTSGRMQSFSLGVEAVRRAAANDDTPEHRIGLEASLRW